MQKKKIDIIIETFRKYRQLREEGIVGSAIANNVGSGNIAGTPEADPNNPPVDLRRGRRRFWNPFFKKLAKLHKRKVV
jgi:hypothetical protein